MKFYRVAALESVNKALNYIDGQLCDQINAGKVGGFCVGNYHEMQAIFEDRTQEQNAKIHAMFSDLQTGTIKMIGKRIKLSDYNLDEIKALCVIWFAKELEQLGEPLPKQPRTIVDPICGELITIRPSTKEFSKKTMTKFVEWLYAMGSEAGVKWSQESVDYYESYIK